MWGMRQGGMLEKRLGLASCEWLVALGTIVLNLLTTGNSPLTKKPLSRRTLNGKEEEPRMVRRPNGLLLGG